MHFQARHHLTGESIADRVEIARSFLKRFIGLMGRKALMKSEGLYFPGCSSIHSMFMRFSIDVLFLDKEMKITKMVSCLKPYRLAFAPLATRHTLELSCGVLNQHEINIGDMIELVQTSDKGGDHNAVQ